MLFYQAPESFEFYKADLPKNWVSFLVIFKNGVRVDFKFIPLKSLKHYYKFEPLSKALIDDLRKLKMRMFFALRNQQKKILMKYAMSFILLLQN
ncbi:aminoglycoside 6-adenylyltransferase [Campylobacter jejuni]|uniref:aminoglycoside 6-adenylyltransferase n=1 Tax=Campylobacter jejuni TaxID=197 RepID=UPI00295565C2|nr:aminoglycoside 6-adenylyltransferase [Campylobacter jejuni]